MRNKIFYLAGIGTTFFGTSIFNFVINWWLIKETGSPELLGLITTISFFPTIFLNVFSGYLVDKWNKKKVMIITDLISGLTCLVAFIFLKDTLSIIILITLIVTLRVTYTFFSVASKSIITLLFSKDDFLNVNKTQSVIKQAAELISPLLAGGIVLIISPSFFILFNGISFFISAFLELQLKIKNNVSISKNKQKLLDGYIYIYQNKKIFISILSALVANFFLAGVMIMIPYISIEILGQDYLYSILMTLEAIGAITAPFLMKYIDRDKNNFMIYLFLTAIGIFTCFPNQYLLMIGVFLCGFFVSAFNISFFTYVQLNTKEENIGKVTGVIYSSAVIAMPIGTAFFTFLSKLTNQYTIVVIGSIFLIFIGLLFLFRRNMLEN
ncbi:MFS transporter [Listeria innocua]|nr:MFS transporter [Listeria innocua]